MGYYVNKSKRINSYLRMLFRAIEFCGSKDNTLMPAISLLKDNSDKDIQLSKLPINKFPDQLVHSTKSR